MRRLCARSSGWLLLLTLAATASGCGRLRFQDLGTERPDAAPTPSDLPEAPSEPDDAGAEPSDVPEESPDTSVDDAAQVPDDAAPPEADSDVADGCPGPLCAARGPKLYWKLDEASGLVARDHSGNGFDGNYVGDDGGPASSTLVPVTQFDDPRSRAFALGVRHAVRLPNMPAALKPALEFTLSIWYRGSATDTAGSELISGANHYLVRVRRDGFEFSKRVHNGTGAGLWTLCVSAVASALDGAWHHVAGVNSAAGMQFYFDGSATCTSGDARPLYYDLTGTDFWIGRHGNLDQRFDFEGNLDEARFYDRALSAAEIAALADGAEN